MRVFERMMFAATYFLIVMRLHKPETVVIPFIQDSITVLIVIGSWYEGLRMTQLPFVLTFIIE